MCAASNLTNPKPPVSTKPLTTSKPIPKWLKMKQQNKSSAGKQTAKPIAKQSLSSAQQKPNEGTRNEKRARWAKKSKPIARPVAVKRGPAKEYVSACCSAPATKPPCGTKTPTKDPDSGKMKDKASGLGHFRCSQCRKACKVKPQAKAKETVITNIPSAPADAVASSITITPYAPYDGYKEVTIATA